MSINVDSDSNRLLHNVDVEKNDDLNHGHYIMYNNKREISKKWAKFFQDSHSPYKIAFPALIRSRWFVVEEDTWMESDLLMLCRSIIIDVDQSE